MNLTEGFIANTVYVDFSADPQYGDDQAYIEYPTRFPTVGLQLIATDALSQIADRIRVNAGFRPMHAMDDFTDDTCDNDGWYDFFVGLNGFSPTRMDNVIDFVVVNSDSPDNENQYTIDLTVEEQRALFERLDAQCKEHLGMGCEDLLAEAKKRMEEDTP